ncbi:hypothetical protein DTL21_20540 [Bremerella cremea]|uniref:Zinc ribbon domain-containing protein n=1 Tax=Blastopirellula marina TaxID=124 RepID=A0A2S8FKB1_9BACT|nr:MULTISPECIES: hypothetical protein [Pirellulaceae]PQO32597.1 hypothetical protein C5Y83_20520 [Blastopirellula marina]RCS45664.1 hypothetical protein DTL21_20540 [Bremerella cremea]
MHDSDEYDDEDWTEDYLDEDQEDTIECPECGADIFDDIDVCPRCGHAIIHSTSPWAGKSLPWVIFGLLGIIAVIVMMTCIPQPPA